LVKISSHDPNALYFSEFLKLGENLPRQTEVEKLQQEASFDDIANILYTSGTTGDSKGVILTHGQFHAAFDTNGRCVPVTEEDRVMNFLPYTHIFERGWAILSLTKGATMIVNTYPLQVQQSMRETHPTCMSAVPRFWEKVYMGVMDKIDHANPIERKLFSHALKVGRKHNIEYLSLGKKPPMALHLEYEMLNRTVFSLVRKELGLENAHFFPTAGAAVSAHVEEFVHSIGLNMIVGYGLTESLATVSCDHLGEPYTVGSVGQPIDTIDIKISEEGEILLKGPTITIGYYNREDLTKQSFTEDGYFKTGDAGYMKDGELFLTERIKDLFKTSNGKYIAPQMIESKLLVDKFIDQIAIIADQRKFVSALIIPVYSLLEEYAREHHIPFNTREELCANQQIIDMMKERIDTLQQQLAHYEQVKRFTLLPHHLSMEKGELTNTLKIRRRVLNENYKAEIEKMYEE
jgi:long-chain acyl-CoA synthetase